jgi:hypothetical protein
MAAPEQAVNSIEDIPEEFLICRDLGHSWAPSDVKISGKGRNAEIHRILQCRSCPTQRVQILDVNGYRLRSKYVYPEDQDKDAAPYKLKGVGRLSVDDNASIRVMSTNHMKAR